MPFFRRTCRAVAIGLAALALPAVAQTDADFLAAKVAYDKGDRAKLAATRVEDYITKLMSQQAQYVDVTEPVQNVLRDKYDNTINPAALDKVLIEAAKIRLATDSTTKAGQPKSVVPLPNTDTAKKK